MPDWDEIVSRHGQAVWQTCHRLLGDLEDAADCYQDVFLKALEISRREEVAAWPGLLKLLATRRALDRLRRRYRERGRVEPWPDPDFVAMPKPGPEDQAESRELASRLKAGLAELPAAQAEAFCLRFLDDLSYEEIARHLMVDANRVGVMIHRARERLGTFLESFEKHVLARKKRQE